MLLSRQSFLVYYYCLLGCNSILLQFDGSLRFPSDAAGFPTTTLPLTVSCIATCAASVSLSEEEENDVLMASKNNPVNRLDGSTNSMKYKTILLGGKCLPSGSMIRQSADAEYEGLLLGLEGLLLLEKQCPELVASSRQGVTIQGDCKTVIQQMQGRARSRKLATYHQHAVDLLGQLTLSSPIRFEHIPRTENIICDQLCAKIAHERQCLTLQQAWDDLDEIIAIKDGTQGRSRSVDSAASSFLDKHLDPCSSSLIPISDRPFIYDKLLTMLTAENHDVEDPTALFQTARCIEADVKTVSKIIHSSKPWLQQSNLQKIDGNRNKDVDGCASEDTTLQHHVLQELVQALGCVASHLREHDRPKEAKQLEKQLKNTNLKLLDEEPQRQKRLDLSCLEPFPAYEKSPLLWDTVVQRWWEEASQQRHPWEPQASVWLQDLVLGGFN